MSRWIKYYADNSFYIGCDSSPTASWIKSNNTNIVRVSLEYSGVKGVIAGAGEYWQSDLYESKYPEGNRRLSRRIMKHVSTDDRFLYTHQIPDNFLSLSFVASPPANWLYNEIQPIKQLFINKWLVLEIDSSGNLQYYFSDNKL